MKQQIFLRHFYFPFLFLVILTSICGNYSDSKAWAGNSIRIGVLEEPRTLNIWLASDTWSRRVLGQIYHPLYIREPKNLKLIPWLAEEEPVYDATALSYTVKIRPAKWSDGSELTSEDIAFTGNIIQEFKIPRHYSKWQFVKKIETPDRHTVVFFLHKPQAIFLTRTLTTPIVQKKEWVDVARSARLAQEPLTQLLNFTVEKPVGNGPFILKEWNPGSFLSFETNKHFFGHGKRMGEYTLGPYIEGMILRTYETTDAAVSALREGRIDMLWWGLQPEHLRDLKKNKDIQIFSNERNALYYLGFNLRQKPFSDVNFRRAVATLIDKDYIVRRILNEHAINMHSIVPAGNKFWYFRDLPKYGEGLTREKRIQTAYEILRRTGYTWRVPPINGQRKVVRGEAIIRPDGRTMESFTILTPSSVYDPQRAEVGKMVQEWLRMIGIPATSKPMPFGNLIQQVKDRRQFALFVLGYGRLSLDPDYLRNFFHSNNDRPGGWNMSGYQNLAFDRIADRSSSILDVEKRKKLIWAMQKIIMRDIPYFPLYNPRLAEGVRKDRFSGWVEMVGGVGNTWSFCQIKLK